MTGLPLRRLATADVGLTVALTIALMGGCVREAQFGDDCGPDGGLLVGHWALDEASGAVAADSSGFGNHGSYEGSLTPTALAAPLLFANPRSLAFDQATNEDVLIPSSASLGLSGPLTLAAWIHPTGEATTQQGIIEKWDSETSGPAANAARGYEFRRDAGADPTRRSSGGTRAQRRAGRNHPRCPRCLDARRRHLRRRRASAVC